MKFRIRPFILSDDEPLLRRLSAARGISVPENIYGLPPTGVVVSLEDEVICIGFLIRCDNRMAIFSDFLSDPSVAPMVRNEAVESMRQHFYRECCKSGHQFVTSFTKHKKLAQRLNGLGFQHLDQGFIQMGRFLWL